MDFSKDGYWLVYNSQMGNIFSEQGRTRVFTEVSIAVCRRRKPEENKTQGKKEDYKTMILETA